MRWRFPLCSRALRVHGTLGLMLLGAAALGLPSPARADWPRPQFGFEFASVQFSPLVDFVAFREGVPESGIPDVPQPRRLEPEDTDFRGFSLGLSLHPDLVVAWTRHTGQSQLKWFVDGQERFDGQERDGVTTRLPEFDYTLQVFSLRWAPGAVRWRDRVGPVLGLGIGSIDQEQTGPLNTDGRPLEWGDQDTVFEAMTGVELRVPYARAGFDVRMARWVFEPESTTVPAETVIAWQWVGWLRVAF